MTTNVIGSSTNLTLRGDYNISLAKTVYGGTTYIVTFTYLLLELLYAFKCQVNIPQQM